MHRRKLIFGLIAIGACAPPAVEVDRIGGVVISTGLPHSYAAKLAPYFMGTNPITGKLPISLPPYNAPGAGIERAALTGPAR